MAAVEGNKRRRTSSHAIARFDDLPEALLVGVAGYLVPYERALFAVAVAMPSMTRDIVSSPPLPSLSPHAIARNRSILQVPEEEWKVLDFENFGRDVSRRMTDDEVTAIMMCIGAIDHVVTLKLTGCVRITGRGLEQIRGSTVVKHIDLGLVGQHESPIIKPDPMISESEVIPVLDSIISAEGSSLEYLYFPKVWRERRTSDLDQFIRRYNQHMESLRLECTCRRDYCTAICQDTDADGPVPWVIQDPNEFPHMRGKSLMRKYGLQRFTCHKCFERVCNYCSHGESENGHFVKHRQCVKCEKDYCGTCCIGDGCQACGDYICPECEKKGPQGFMTYNEGGYTDLCLNCSEPCKGCNRNQSFDLVFSHCEESSCKKGHCEDCFDGEKYDVSSCDHCKRTFCLECRYAWCSKDWARACPSCMDTIGVIIPTAKRSAFSCYSSSVWKEVNAANRRESFWGIGQIVMRQYKALTDKELAHWEEMATTDNVRNHREMDVFEKEHGTISNLSPFLLYANSVRHEVKNQMAEGFQAKPDAKFSEVAKICAQQFEHLPEGELCFWLKQGNGQDMPSFFRELEDFTNVWSPKFKEKLFEYGLDYDHIEQFEDILDQVVW